MEFNLLKVGETINAKETMSSLQIAELTGKKTFKCDARYSQYP